MKRIYILLFPILLFSCAAQKSITSTEITSNSNRDTETVKLYETVCRDSVVIRDSVVLHADGSVSKIHNEKQSKIQIQNVYWYIHERIATSQTIYKTEKQYFTKYKHDFIWYTGLFAYLFVIIYSIYKLNKKFNLWQKLIPGL